MKIRLIIIDEEGNRHSVPFLREEISAGRGEGNTIRLPERNISRKHAILTREGDEVYIEDLDSYNGIILNGNRIARRTHFFPGDILQIGDFTIELEIGDDGALEKVEIDQESLLEARHIMEERCGDTRTDIIRMKDDEPEIEEPEPEALPQTKPEPEPKIQMTPETPVKTVSQPPAKQKETQLRPEKRQPAEQNKAIQSAKAPDEKKPQTIKAPIKPEPQDAPLPDPQQATRAQVEFRRPTPEIIVAPQAVLQTPGTDEEQEIKRSGGGHGIMWAMLALAGLAVIVVGVYMLNSTPEKRPGSLPIEPIKKIEVQNRQVNLDELLPPDEENMEDKNIDAASPEILAELEHARSLMSETLWREAEKALSRIIEKSPGHAEATALRIKCRKEKENKNNYTQGMRYFGQKNLLMAYMTLGQIDNDSFYFEKSSKHRDLARTNLLNEYVKSGWARYKSKKYSEAMKSALSALELDPTWTDALELKEQCEEALEKMQPEKEEDPYNAKQHYQLGVNYFQNKDYNEAIKHFLTSTRLDPEYALAYRAMGSSYASIGDMDKAMLAYRKYVKLSPSSPDVEDVKEIIEEYQNKEKQ